MNQLGDGYLFVLIQEIDDFEFALFGKHGVIGIAGHCLTCNMPPAEREGLFVINRLQVFKSGQFLCSAYLFCFRLSRFFFILWKIFFIFYYFFSFTFIFLLIFSNLAFIQVGNLSNEVPTNHFF